MLNPCDIARSRLPIFSYPSKPAEYYQQKCDEWERSKKGIKQLYGVFAPETNGGIIYIPKPLTELCISYYQEDPQIVIERAIYDLRMFLNAGPKSFIVDLLADSTKRDAKSLHFLCDRATTKAAKYLKWFRMRQLIPASISIDEIDFRTSESSEQNAMPMIRILMGEENVFDMSFIEHGYYPSTMGFRFYLHGVSLQWGGLWKIVSNPPLIGANDRLSKNTFEHMNKLISSRLSRKREIEVSRFFISFASLQIWIDDLLSFSHLSNPTESQKNCKEQWNNMYDHFEFGPPFSRF